MHHCKVRLQINLSQQRRHLPCQIAFLLGLWTLLVHVTNNKEANMGLKQRNKSKITYTPWAASMLDCIVQELENRVFPWVLCTTSQSEAIIWGHMTCMQVFSQVILEHPKWRGCQHNLRFFHPWRSGILI